MKSVFFYGVMKASKSAELILRAKTYEVQGVKPIIIKPTIDTRNKDDTVSSRIGIKTNVTYNLDIDDNQKARKISRKAMKENRPIFADEAQFFSPQVITELINATIEPKLLHNKESSNVNVFLFGLLKDYNGKLFNGTKTIIEQVDRMQEIKTRCETKGCGRKATYNYIKPQENNSNSDIQIGDNEYSVYCAVHYFMKRQEDEKTKTRSKK